MKHNLHPKSIPMGHAQKFISQMFKKQQFVYLIDQKKPFDNVWRETVIRLVPAGFDAGRV